MRHRITVLLLLLASLVLNRAAGFESKTFVEPNRTFLTIDNHVPLEVDAKATVISLESFAHGTPIIDMELRNLRSTARSFEIDLPAWSKTVESRDVRLEPKGSARVVMPILYPINGSHYFTCLSIKETTPGSKHETANLSIRTIHYRNRLPYDAHADILMDGELSAEAFAKNMKPPKKENKPARSYSKYNPSHHGSEQENDEYDCSILSFGRPADKWPADYRVYTVFDAVVITPKLQAALPPDVRQALDDYTKLGGAVITTPDSSPSGGITSPDIAARFRKDIANAQARLRGDLNLGVTIGDNLTFIPLDVKSSMPTGLLLVLLGLFAVVFIPLMIFLCARRNQRLRALLVLPACSFTLAAIVWILALICYGTTPTTRMQSITQLDQTSRRAVTRGQFGVFSPVRLSGALHFPADSTILQRNEDTAIDSTAVYRIGDDIHLVGNFTPTLTATFFDFQRVAHHSEKLDVRPATGNVISVSNLLGAKIAKGRLNLDGRVYELSEIEPGASAKLTPVNTATTNAIDVAAALFNKKSSFGRNWPQIVKKLSEPDLMPPDRTYFVRLDGSPFFPSPLGSRKTISTHESIVVGTFAEDAK